MRPIKMKTLRDKKETTKCTNRTLYAHSENYCNYEFCKNFPFHIENAYPYWTFLFDQYLSIDCIRNYDIDETRILFRMRNERNSLYESYSMKYSKISLANWFQHVYTILASAWELKDDQDKWYCSRYYLYIWNTFALVILVYAQAVTSKLQQRQQTKKK